VTRLARAVPALAGHGTVIGVDELVTLLAGPGDGAPPGERTP
jgi:hypothetical protein